VVRIILHGTAPKGKGVVGKLREKGKRKGKKKGRGEVKGALVRPLRTSPLPCRSLGIKVKTLLIGLDARLQRLTLRRRPWGQTARKGSRL